VDLRFKLSNESSKRLLVIHRKLKLFKDIGEAIVGEVGEHQGRGFSPTLVQMGD
jgi:hypothetical protein